MKTFQTVQGLSWCTSGFGDKGSFVVTDGNLGRDGPDRDLDVLEEMLNV